MKCFTATSAVALLFAFATTASGQVGGVMSAPTALQLYRSLPQGLYCTDSPIIATVAPGEKLKIVSETNLKCALVLGRRYVEIERIGRLDPAAPRRGYVRLS